MLEKINVLIENIYQSQLAMGTLSFIGLLIVAILIDLFFKGVLLKLVFKALRHSKFKDAESNNQLRFIPWLAHIIPALIIAEGTKLILGLPEGVATFISNLAQVFIVIMMMISLSQLLNLINYLYEKGPNANDKPIKGYVQIAKIFIYLISILLIAAIVINRSPLILISGLGAAAAVLMLVFQNTLLSLVASVQISAGQLIRIGDWVEMRQQNADGFVIDIALHTVRIQNWDKTITTVPTKNFISESFINWRGMQESGGRRIKRSILVNQHSIRFLTEEDIKRLKEIKLITSYIYNKEDEIKFWNKKLEEKGDTSVNYRRLTNIGTFRAYVERYIKEHPEIRQDMTMIVRQMAPTPEGLPIEVYCFTNTVAWVNYEAIQSDIFDHLLSIIGEFGLEVYQSPSGQDFRALKNV